MKITNNHRPAATPFSSLKPGECFLYGENIYMCYYDSRSNWNTINLRNGDGCEFAAFVGVIPAEAELIIT